MLRSSVYSNISEEYKLVRMLVCLNLIIQARIVVLRTLIKKKKRRY